MANGCGVSLLAGFVSDELLVSQMGHLAKPMGMGNGGSEKPKKNFFFDYPNFLMVMGEGLGSYTYPV